MVLHSSLATATAAAHLQDLIDEAQRYRTASTLRSFARRVARLKSGENRRCAVPR